MSVVVLTSLIASEVLRVPPSGPFEGGFAGGGVVGSALAATGIEGEPVELTESQIEVQQATPGEPTCRVVIPSLNPDRRYRISFDLAAQFNLAYGSSGTMNAVVQLSRDDFVTPVQISGNLARIADDGIGGESPAWVTRSIHFASEAQDLSLLFPGYDGEEVQARVVANANGSGFYRLGFGSGAQQVCSLLVEELTV